MIAKIPIRIAVVIPDYRELKLALSELGWELPVPYPEVLLGNEPTERVREDQEPDFVLRIEPGRISPSTESRCDRYSYFWFYELRYKLTIQHRKAIKAKGLLINSECNSAIGSFPGVPCDGLVTELVTAGRQVLEILMYIQLVPKNIELILAANELGDGTFLRFKAFAKQSLVREN
jgi:hypothetical protein